MVPSPRTRDCVHRLHLTARIARLKRGAKFEQIYLLFAFTLLAFIAGCTTASSPSTPPPQVSVAVKSPSTSVVLGLTQQFTSTVTGTSNTAVSWSVNNVAGGNAAVGTIDANGLYTAPADLPSPASITIKATSQADNTATGSASTTVISDVVVTVATNPAFTLSVPTTSTVSIAATIASQGKPDQKVNWFVNGVAGGNATVGTIASAGATGAAYKAPASVPTPFTVTISATSAADSSKSASLPMIVAGTIASVSQTISAALGGTITLPDGSSLTLAPGALPADEMVTLSEVSRLPNQPANPAISSVGPGLLLTFATPVQFSVAAKSSSSAATRAGFRTDASTAAVPAMQFLINTSKNNVPSLTGSISVVNFVDAANNSTFMGTSGSYDSTTSVVSAGVGFDLLGAISNFVGGTANKITSIGVSAANFIGGAVQFVANTLVHIYKAPNFLKLDASNTNQPWPNYPSNKLTQSECPTGKTLVVVHGMLSDVEDSFPLNSIIGIRNAGGYESVVGFDYDWFQSIATSGGQLAGFLDSLTNDCGLAIDIEAHSEGVPVSLSALTQTKPGTNAKIERLVSIAGPIMGTPVANDSRMLGTLLMGVSILFVPDSEVLNGLSDLLRAPFTADLMESTPNSHDALDLIRSALSAGSLQRNPQIIAVAGDYPQSLLLQALASLMYEINGVTHSDGVIPVTSALAFSSGLNRLKVYPLFPFAQEHNGLVPNSNVMQTVGEQVSSPTNPPLLIVSSAGECSNGIMCDGPPGTSFLLSGSSYTGASGIGRYELDQTGTVITLSQLTSDPMGVLSQSAGWEVSSDCSTTAGMNVYFAVDWKTQVSSNAITDQILSGNCVSNLNPTPMILSLQPGSASVGASPLTLTISGTGFVPNNSAISFGGALRSTSFISASQLAIQLGSSDLANTANYPVFVVTQPPAGGNSNTVNFNVVSTSAGTVTINPPSITAPEGGIQMFSATVSGGGTVTWSVLEGAGGGTITNLGIYTAPNVTGTFHVVATNSIDGTKSATATVTVTTPVPVGTITTVAGGGSGCSQQTDSVGDGCPATIASLASPSATALDQAGNFYIVDKQNNRIRVVNTQTTAINILGVTIQPGTIATVAGTGSAGFAGDNGPATSAQFNGPADLALDALGNIFMSDGGNNAVRLINTQSQAITFGGISIPPGNIVTVAGRGVGCPSQNDSVGDGCPGTSAQLSFPDGIGLDNTGNLYIADSYDHRIRKVVQSTGVISTVAGTGSSGYSGDSGLATNAQLWSPSRVRIDASGNLYIADYYNSVVRKVAVSTNIISTVAGQLFNGFGWNVSTGDGGPATSANTSVLSIALDASGNLYIADYYNERIRAVNMQGTTVTLFGVSIGPGVIATVAGNGTNGYSGDNGPALSAHIDGPTGLFIDKNGNLYFADSINNVVRKVTGK